MSVTPRCTRSVAVAFSLIEILISVLVLGIGLLGIGAVFPVVIREQRIGTERVEGVIVANNAVAEARLLTDGLVRDWWEDLVPAPQGNGRWRFAATTPPSYQAEDLDWQFPELDLGTGEITFVSDDVGDKEVTVEQRIYPKATTATTATPQYVWDLAARVVPYNTLNGQDGAQISKHDRMRVALFVRRIDPGIRPTELGGVRAAGEPHPVAVDGDGQPSRNGRGEYAELKAVEIRVDVDEARDRLEFPGISDEDWNLVRQPNQRLVDGLGTVYTVIRELNDVPGNGRYVQVDPLIPASVTRGDVEDLLDEVVFSPQVPAGVTTYLVTPDFDDAN